MDTTFKLGTKTLLDPDAVEYQWIRSMTLDGLTRSQINESIKRCLGGNNNTANLMRQVANKEASVNQLLTELELHPMGEAWHSPRG
uniref:hypothetical protein n=1 Tax=Thaumasiovibrio occultus TaxID=1891184 RepID=UPI000B34C27E|nr:hypothetical protein [Thaumasiovibrio occultus]